MVFSQLFHLICLSFSILNKLIFSSCDPNRYEIEYDENRLEIGFDIGRRFLGLECENNGIGDTRYDDGDVVEDNHKNVLLQFPDNDDLNKCERRNSNDATSKQETTNTTATITKPVSNTTTNYSTTSSNKLSKENVNADSNNEDGVNKSTNDNNKDTSKEKDELVLDVLNDDLIEKVRGKISCE